jgi:hypothetical protein
MPIFGNYSLFQLCSNVLELFLQHQKYTIYALLNRFSKQYLAYFGLIFCFNDTQPSHPYI